MNGSWTAENTASGAVNWPGGLLVDVVAGNFERRWAHSAVRRLNEVAAALLAQAQAKDQGEDQGEEENWQPWVGVTGYRPQPSYGSSSIVWVCAICGRWPAGFL